MLKVIIDTNILISGLLKSPSCRKIIRLLEEKRFILITSPPILDELMGVISRPKFHNVILRETIEKLIEIMKTQAILVKPSRLLFVIKEDPADNRFLEAALQANVDLIISGNHHLLSLKNFHNIPIITSKEFLSRLKEK